VTLYWHSLADFLAMGGYAPYVWGAFGVTTVVMVWELLALRRRRRQALEQVRQWRLLNGESNDTAP
jgi:heme exporter protein D